MKAVLIVRLAVNAMAVVAFASSRLSADEIHVPGDQPTIQLGISAAKDGDTVVVAPGVYLEHVDFMGKKISVVSSDGSAVTTIDGQRSGFVVTFQHAESDQSILDGFTIRNGSLGAIYCSSSPVIRNNTMTENVGGTVVCRSSAAPLIVGNLFLANVDGGIDCDFLCKPVIWKNRFAGNRAHLGASAVVCRTMCQVTIVDNVFDDNQSNDSSTIEGTDNCVLLIARNRFTGNVGGRAGALYATDCAITVVRNLFRDNTSQGSGGALALSGGRGTEIEDNQFQDNVASPYGGAGGAVSVASGHVTSNAFIGNVAASGGALVIGSGEVAGNTFSRNRADGDGGAVAFTGTSFENNLFVHNVAGGSGGALFGSFISYPPFTIDYCTFSDNHAAVLGGALAAFLDGSITNSVFWGDRADANDDEMRVTDATSVTYSDVMGGHPGAGNLDVDPRFADVSIDDFSLAAASPCLDAGDPAVRTCGRDCARAPRRLDADWDGRARVDMGAFEHGHVHLQVVGDATPLSTIVVITTGEVGLDAILLVAVAGGETCYDPFGPLFVSFAEPWRAFAWGKVPSAIPIRIPFGLPQLNATLQVIATVPGHFLGNTSNDVQLPLGG
ncbi:MAG: right-handed parallel beta-helix repeat-containing protein [Planctomycetota bacterium]